MIEGDATTELRQPLGPLADGRDPATGRFLPGWRGGPGNPHGATTARYRAALLEAVTEGDLRDVVAVLVARARAGEPWAVRELLDRTLGKVTTPEDATDPPGDAGIVFNIAALPRAEPRTVFNIPAPRIMGSD